MSEQAGEYIGPYLDPEKFLEKHHEFAVAESSAASEAGERRQEIGALFEGMRLENKAASQARAILKMKNEGKRRDAVRSWQQLLPMLENEILADTPDMFPENGTAEEAKVDPVEEPEREPSEEEAEFNAAVDDVADDEGQVVTPVQFGGSIS